MKVGAEPKKIVLLAGLLVVAVVLYFINSADDGPPPDAAVRPAPARPATSAKPSLIPTTAPAAPPVRLPSGRTSVQEFRPTLKPRRAEDRLDPMTIDPTLRLDLLASLQQVTLEGGQRSLFEFAPAPVPKPDKPPVEKIIPKPEKDAAREAAESKPAKPSKPPPPAIPLKFYGYLSPLKTPSPVKRAFFLDGDEIHVAGEGDIIKKRYKVIRIGVNSAVVEDVEHEHEQTLPLVPDMAG